MNLMEILLLEAVRINNGKEAYELIKSNKIGVKLDPSYKTAGDDIIPYLDKVINDVGVGNAPFAIQLLANKVPTDSLSSVVSGKALKEIIACKNKPWAKAIPGYKEAIDFSSKEKYDQSKWNDLANSLQSESQKHGKATKGSGSLKDVKELYNDGTWTLQVPTSWDGAKAASFYGKKGEKQTPTGWCTRVEKRYYNMYAENSPIYIIRNWENGKAYQIAFDKISVHFLDQDDSKGDEVTKGDLKDIPNELLKKIKWNGRTLADFKKESERTEMKKGETDNPTGIDLSRLTWTFEKKAEWEPPRDEGNGAVSQVMKNLNTFSGNNNFVTFMIKGKPFKFKKRDGYIKKYYYKDKPDFLILSILSKLNGISPFVCAYDLRENYWKDITINEFNELVKDKGYLADKVSAEFDKANNKWIDRTAEKNINRKNEKNFLNRMADKFANIIRNKYIEYGLIDNENDININTTTRSKNLGSGMENFGNFMPVEFEVYIYAPGVYSKQCVVTIFFGIKNRKCYIKKAEGYNAQAVNKFKIELEKATNEAYKEYIKNAVHDEYGRRKRSEYRERSKGIVTYDLNKQRKLQFEDYFPY